MRTARTRTCICVDNITIVVVALTQCEDPAHFFEPSGSSCAVCKRCAAQGVEKQIVAQKGAEQPCARNQKWKKKSKAKARSTGATSSGVKGSQPSAARGQSGGANAKAKAKAKKKRKKA